jgi:hypothetical protein
MIERVFTNNCIMIDFLIGDEIRQIIDDNSKEIGPSSSDFWILVASLKVDVSNVEFLNVL